MSYFLKKRCLGATAKFTRPPTTPGDGWTNQVRGEVNQEREVGSLSAIHRDTLLLSPSPRRTVRAQLMGADVLIFIANILG